MGFDFAEQVDGLGVRGVVAGEWVGEEASAVRAGDDGGVVLVGGENALAVEPVGVANHRKERVILRGSIDFPSGVKDFMAAVLGVGLREHHEFDVGGVATKASKGGGEVVNFVGGEREAEFAVGGFERGAAFGEKWDGVQWAGLFAAKEHRTIVERVEDDLRHRIDEAAAQCVQLVRAEDVKWRMKCVVIEREPVFDDPLNPADFAQAAESGDVGGLARPRRNRPRPRGNDERSRSLFYLVRGRCPRVGLGCLAGPVSEQFF